MSCHGCLMTCKILISLKVPFYFTLFYTSMNTVCELKKQVFLKRTF